MLILVIPCQDGYAMQLSSKPTQAHVHDSQEEGRDGHCSPFCSCSCCHIHFNMKNTTNLIDTPNILIQETAYLFPHEDQFVSNYFGSIWQPPKI